MVLVIVNEEKKVNSSTTCTLQGLLKSPKDQGMFSAFVSWLATGHSLPSYMDASACGEFSWFAYHILLVENEFEEESQLWSAVQRELLTSPDVGVDQALKVGHVHLVYYF